LYIKVILYYFTVVSLLVTYIGYGVTPATNISTGVGTAAVLLIGETAKRLPFGQV